MRCSLALLMVLSAAGCAVTQDERTPVPHRYAVDPVTGKGFYYYIPSTYTHDRPAPVIVTCHGTPPYDVAEHHVREWKMIGQQHGCIIIAPVLEGTNGITGDGPVASMQENERTILSILSFMGYRVNIDRANIWITGFSGGGFPTYWIGLRHPELFSQVVARSCNFCDYNLEGWFPPEATATPTYVYYGDAEPGAIQDQSQRAIKFLTSHGFNVESRVIPGLGHARRPDIAMEFFLRNRKPPRGSLSETLAIP